MKCALSSGNIGGLRTRLLRQASAEARESVQQELLAK